VTTPLPDEERREAGAAFADVHSLASVSWRMAARPDATRSEVLAAAQDIESRLALLRKALDAPRALVTEQDYRDEFGDFAGPFAYRLHLNGED
jgi:hypothetical protein